MNHRSAKKRVYHTLKKEVSALNKLKKISWANFSKAIALLEKRRGRIIITGVGKSGFIGMKIASTLTSLGQTASFMHPVEALHGDSGMVSKGDILIAISFSGTSPEITKITKYLKQSFKTKIVSITGNKKSQLAELSDVVLPISVDDEGSPYNLAPMASTTATLVVGDMLASALTSPSKFKKQHFAKFHPGGGLGLSLAVVGDVMFTGRKVPLVSETTSIEKTLKKMSKGLRKGFAGVCSKKGVLIGIVTDGDIRRFLLQNSDIENKTAKDIMTKNPKTIRRRNNLEEALSLMENYKITSLFVLDNAKKPIGVIHMHTIIEGYLT